MKHTKKIITTTNRWRDTFNPLRRLTMPHAVHLMERAQAGDMSGLQYLYAAETGIEATDPDLMTLIERTISGIAELNADIITLPETTRGYDTTLANEQAAFLRESYAQCDNLDDAIEHLVLARFRGFAHLSPHLAPDWTLEHLEPLPQYCMVRDGTNNTRWAWNPAADSTLYHSIPTPQHLAPTDTIFIYNPRPVNRIGLIKYVRATTAEKDWDAYVEIYGIPGVFVIMPPSVPTGKEDEYAAGAEQAAEAGSGALPHGSDVKTLSEARSMQPFSMRLEWLQRQLILAGTGGLLTMLTAPGSGTLAGSAHQEAWQMIIRRLAYLVCRPLNRQYERPALAARFPGRPALARMELRAIQETSVNDITENIVKLANAGYRVSPDTIANDIGYTVTDTGPATPPGATPPLQNVAKAPTNVAKILNDSRYTQTAPRLTAALRAPLADPITRIATLILSGHLTMEQAVEQARATLATLAPNPTATQALESRIATAMQAAAAATLAQESPHA